MKKGWCQLHEKYRKNQKDHRREETIVNFVEEQNKGFDHANTELTLVKAVEIQGVLSKQLYIY